MSGTKFDTDKPATHLIPPDPLLDIAEVFAFGARKYGDRNWEQGIAVSRIYGALLRHLLAYWAGQWTDEESGLPHLSHAGCCMLMLMQLSKDPDHDDRPGDDA